MTTKEQQMSSFKTIFLVEGKFTSVLFLTADMSHILLLHLPTTRHITRIYIESVSGGEKKQKLTNQQV